MPRPYSTKRPKPIPAEFEAFFIAHGWARCNHVFGKRETLRYVTTLGIDRRSAQRSASSERADAPAENRPATHAPAHNLNVGASHDHNHA